MRSTLRAIFTTILALSALPAFGQSAQLQQAPKVTVTVKSYQLNQSDGTTRYEYRMVNAGANRIVGFAIGNDYYHGISELQVPPAGWSFDSGLAPGSAVSPVSWRATLVATEESPFVELEWRNDGTADVLPGQTATGFSVVTSQQDPHYLNGHWTAFFADSTVESSLLVTSPSPARTVPHTFTIEGDHFALDGKPFKLLSGELHYARIPREYWHARLKMAKAMGLNTVATYVFWNVHEPTPNHFDFSGNNDVAAFIRAAQEEGLWVILRDGPYSCAEWDFGGFPAWLLKDPKMSTTLRTNDPAFMVPAERWITRLAQETAPLQIGHGGPVIITQVENEYGSFDKQDTAPPDPTHAYMTHMRDIFLRAGFTASLLDTVDGGDELPYGGIPGVFTGVNFGLGQHQSQMDKLAAFQPGKPLVVTEYWPGWFDYWGHPHQTRPLKTQLEDLDYILNRGAGINLYMFHGGTSFGFMSGANWNNNTYFSDVTSYDYGAPLDEAGHPTPKFLAFRKIFAKYATCPAQQISSRLERNATARPPHLVRTATDARVPHPSRPYREGWDETPQTGEACLPPIPDSPPIITIPQFTLTESTPLWANLPTPIQSDTPKPMEQFDQAYGYILYRHQLPAAISGNLVLDELHDYARIYLNGKLAGTLDRRDARRDKQSTLAITTTGPARLDILVENSARINFSPAMRGESKGITKSVTLAGHALTKWQIYPLPMTTLPALYVGPRLTPAVKGQTGDYTGSGQPVPRGSNASLSTDSPSFYRGYFTLTTTGDTFLDVRKLGKGALWINGHPIGRFWKIGPQDTLFIPGPWLRKGDNEIVVFDLDPSPAPPTVQGLSAPLLDGPVIDTSIATKQE
jgi:beta-galactosidase